MASLIPSAQKQTGIVRRCVEIQLDSGARPRITLGPCSARDGEDVRRRMEEIVGDLRLGREHTKSLCEWLNKLSPKIQKKLEECGLMRSSKMAAMSLGDFLDSVKAKARVKETTLITYSNPMRNLIAHFGRGRPLDSISHADALDFKDYLHAPEASEKSQPLSKVTISRRITMCRQFFTIASKKKLIAENPFIGIKGGSQRNKKRLVFVEEALVQQMIAATKDDDWKIILALARYGGLRMPSELVELRWKHMDFGAVDGSIFVHSPKTEHHPGKETRYVPMFDELRAVIAPIHAKGVDPEAFVIRNPNYRRPKANMRTQFGKIAKKAGVEPWGKAFQNMRATRETELIKLMGITEACEIIGNSPNVAFQHYDMVSPKLMSSAIQRAREAKKAG